MPVIINPRPRRRPAFTLEQREQIAVVLDRFIDECGVEDCWPWNGSRLPTGYGKFSITVSGQRRAICAHRAVFDRANGYLPKVVRHQCDNPPCCNPRHLLGGYPIDNVRDMIERGRAKYAHGADHVRAKLSDHDVQEIRSSNQKHSDVAAKFGVSTSVVTRIKGGKAWRHVVGVLPTANPDHRKGIFNPRAKLSLSQVAEIREATGRQIDIAQRYGVSQTTVSAIKTGRHWPLKATSD